MIAAVILPICPDISIDGAPIDKIVKDNNIEQECRDVLTNLVNAVHGQLQWYHRLSRCVNR